MRAPWHAPVVQEFLKNGTAQSAGVELDSVNGIAIGTSNSAISIDALGNYFVAYQTQANSGNIDAVYGVLI